MLALLKELKTRSIPTAVGSSTPRLNIETIMAMTGLGEFFQAIASAEDVTIGKPDPQVFLKAAAKINAQPADCIVFEDAHVGIEAGKRAGMKVVAVATTHPLDSLHQADIAFQNLDGITVDRVLSSL